MKRKAITSETNAADGIRVRETVVCFRLLCTGKRLNGAAPQGICCAMRNLGSGQSAGEGSAGNRVMRVEADTRG